MSDTLDLALLNLGMAFSVLQVLLIQFSRKRVYAGWAKLISVIACVSGLGWGSLGLILSHPHLSLSRNLYYSVVHTKGLLGGLCLGFVLSILIARPYQTRDIDATTQPQGLTGR